MFRLPFPVRSCAARVRTSVVASLIGLASLEPIVAATHINESAHLLEALGGQIRAPYDQGVSRQYDFWIGAWEANWRAAVEGELDNADSTTTTDAWVFPILHGKALVELARGQTETRGTRTQGFSIRYFDPTKGRWVMAQNWPRPNGGYGFTDQLMGDLRHGRVQVYSSWTDAKGPITRRYTFSDVHSMRFRWDDATTRDSGTTWKPNQVTEFRRKQQPLKLPAVGEPLPDWEDGAHCTEAPFHRFDGLEGDWRGHAIDGEGESWPARLVAARFQNGCSVLFALSWADRQIFQAITFEPARELWFAYQLDNQPGTPHEFRIGSDKDGTLTFVRNPQVAIVSETDLYAWPEQLLLTHGQPRTVWTEFSDQKLSLRFDEWQDDWVTELTVALTRMDVTEVSNR